MYHHPTWPPALINVESGLYIIDGPNSIKVSRSTTIQQAQEIHRKMFPKFYLPKQPVAIPKTISFKSESGHTYQITIDRFGKKTCTCPGYTYRRKCRHIEG